MVEGLGMHARCFHQSSSTFSLPSPRTHAFPCDTTSGPSSMCDLLCPDLLNNFGFSVLSHTVSASKRSYPHLHISKPYQIQFSVWRHLSNIFLKYLGRISERQEYGKAWKTKMVSQPTAPSRGKVHQIKWKCSHLLIHISKIVMLFLFLTNQCNSYHAIGLTYVASWLATQIIVLGFHKAINLEVAQKMAEEKKTLKVNLFEFKLLITYKILKCAKFNCH